MRKFFVILMGVMLMIGAVSCTCSKQKAVELNVENTISADRESVYLNHGKDTRWFETRVVLKDWLDEGGDGSVEEIVNVIQTYEQIDSTSADTYVYYCRHTVEGRTEEEHHGFMVGDENLNDRKILVNFKSAYEKVKASDFVKPHSRQVVLRKEAGMIEANPQWIFGNQEAQLYVDATTGEVRDTNPAFPEGFHYAFSW